jgi:hypothetical protein
MGTSSFNYGCGDSLSKWIYMNAPNGMDIEGDKCLRLKKTIHGLVQSASEFVSLRTSDFWRISQTLVC